MLAIESGRMAIAEKLLTTGIDPNRPDNNGTTCLQACCGTGMIAVATMLVEYVT